jgi:hypothetical protein
LLLVGGGIYFGFRPPSPETLYARAEKLMSSPDTDEWEKARYGPIADYLKRYGNQENNLTRQVQDWADKVDPIVRERQLNIAKNRKKWDSDEEGFAVQAINHEDSAEYDKAWIDWQKVKENSAKSEDARVLALVAAKHLEGLKQLLLKQANEKEEAIRNRVTTLKKTKGPDFDPKDWPASDWPEKAPDAAAAIWEEDPRSSATLSVVLDKWEKLKADTTDQPVWQLMAERNIQRLMGKGSGGK